MRWPSARTSCTDLTTSSIPTWDFTRYRSAPKDSPRLRWSSLDRAVIIITLIPRVSVVDRKISNISKPEILGIITSLIIRFGRSLIAIARASSPSPAETISYPSANSLTPYISRKLLSSSTNKIFVILPPLYNYF